MGTGKKSRAGRIALYGIVLIAAMVLTFFISYFSVSKLYSGYLNKKDAQEQSEEEQSALLEAEENVANCGFTMVYLDDPETEEVDYSLLRIFNELTCEMSIIQIRVNSQGTLSYEFY